MNSKYIQYKLWSYFRNHNYKLSNAFVFNWESDFFSITNSGYCYEIEIKISHNDFKKDFEKTIEISNKLRYKHDILIDNEFTFKPNKFFFAFPKGLIDNPKIDKHYGIIEISKYDTKIIRNAGFLHKEKLMSNNIFMKSLLDKFYWRNMDLRHTLELRDFDLKFGQKRIKI